jgi:ADP-ribose pyrophosphatase YjhB (NUDIX family)
VKSIVKFILDDDLAAVKCVTLALDVFPPTGVQCLPRARAVARALIIMSTSKTLLSKLWKIIPRGLRWRAIWAISPRFVVGVTGVVLNARDEFLLAHHVFRDPFAWGLPGGAIRYGERLEHAICREILEETGLSVLVEGLLNVTLHPDWPNLNCHFLCTVDGTPEPRVNGELFEAGFYTLDDLPGPIAPGQRETIEYGLRAHECLEEWKVGRLKDRKIGRMED